MKNSKVKNLRHKKLKVPSIPYTKNYKEFEKNVKWLKKRLTKSKSKIKVLEKFYFYYKNSVNQYL